MTLITRRDPARVMRLGRLGSFHQSRLSFMRILTRRMAADKWRFEQTFFDIDENGVGVAVYTAHGPDRSYSLVAFAHDLPADQRSDRVIADAWDATFTLFDGIPTRADVERLSRNVPLQEAGRISQKELSLSRANRSVRLWAHVVDALAAGRQPDKDQIDAVGYLMRTTAVYGSGKFGAADREQIADRPEFYAPFQVEMLSVFLTRWFIIDLVQHMAHQRAIAQGKTAAQLSPELARSIGIGNSTGLGMAPFLLNHPVLFNNWVAARENAILAVRNVQKATTAEISTFRTVLEQAKHLIAGWTSLHPIQITKIASLQNDVDQLCTHLAQTDLGAAYPWNALFLWAEDTMSVEGQEWLASLLLEPYGPLVDKFSTEMSADNTAHFRIAGLMTISQLRAALIENYQWALDTDWDAPQNQARAWYVSEEKLEPRLGERHAEPIEKYEQPLAPGRDACALYRAIAHWPDTAEVAQFILRHPEHRHILRRVQIVTRAPYAEIRDNTICSKVMPIDMLRCKLSFFGATKFDPRSDRWVRICMFGNAPLPYELTSENSDFWIYPQQHHEALV
jgi:hypothetical protein